MMQLNEGSPGLNETPADHALTLASLGTIAFAIAIVTHEGLGHGLATLAVVALGVLGMTWKGSVAK